MRTAEPGSENRLRGVWDHTAGAHRTPDAGPGPRPYLRRMSVSPAPQTRRQLSHSHPRVLIAGGGVSGVEAALALRAYAGATVAIELIAPEDAFTYRPLTVAEPFGYEQALRLPLAELERTHAVVHRRAALEAVKAPTHEVVLDSGETLPYQALVVATGARPEAWLAGSLCFTGAPAVEPMRRLLARLAAGDVQDLCFAAPPGAWTLPLYELALLTAGWCADHGVIGTRLVLVTPEAEPLDAFGTAAAHLVRNLLGDRGIRCVTEDAATAWDGRHLRLASGALVPADAVISVPVLRHGPMPGLPIDGDGFIPVDEHARVRGVDDVYATGDATDQPIKQGGLAAQQADVAAATIAQGLGLPIKPEPFRPVLRGLLLGGVGAAFLRRAFDAPSEASFEALWWPPTKVAGRHLGPYLADHHRPGGARGLEDTSAAARDRAELRRIALELAQAEAEWGDVRMALRWLRTREWLDGTLTPEMRELRADWRAQSTG